MKNIVLVPVTYFLGSLFFPMPWARQPNSLKREVVHVSSFFPFSKASIDCFVPVSWWYTWFEMWLSNPSVFNCNMLCARDPCNRDLVKLLCRVLDLRGTCMLGVHEFWRYLFVFKSFHDFFCQVVVVNCCVFFLCTCLVTFLWCHPWKCYNVGFACWRRCRCSWWCLWRFVVMCNFAMCFICACRAHPWFCCRLKIISVNR